MIRTKQSFGVSGVFRVVVRDGTGKVKLDTGTQPNLVVDNGLKHYLGIPMTNSAGKVQSSAKSGVMTHCCVGTGNKPPKPTDVALHNLVAFNTTSRDTEYGKEEPTSGNHEGYVKLWKRSKYIFDAIENQNITEVGLVAWKGSETIDGQNYEDTYSLTTRALIKDTGGTPIAVTVAKGDVLEVTYQIDMYADIKRQTGTFTLTTSKSNNDITDTYEYFLQPYNIDNGQYLDQPFSFSAYYNGSGTWGVKETDSELSASYDLTDTIYNSITYSNISAISSKTSGSYTTSYSTADKYSDRYFVSEQTENSFENKRNTYKNTAGVYTHVYENGIRAYRVDIGQANIRTFMSGLVVLKNKANGQGIKKTNRQMWEYIHFYTVDRWEG